MNSKTIGIIGAMDCEIAAFKAVLKNIEEIKYGVFTFYKGELSGKNIVLIKSGVGKAASAVCTQILADKFSPEFIINTGIAGGIAPDVNICDIVIAEKLVQHDFDASAIGYAKGYICNDKNPDEPTYFYADKELVKKFKKVLSEKMPDEAYKEGIIASGDMFIGSKEKKQELFSLFGAIAAEMEGAAIAHAASLNEIPFIVIRAVSDAADENAGQGHKFMEKEAAEKSARAIKLFIEQL